MTQKLVFTIAGIECPNCVLKLEGIEDRLAGVACAEASYHKGQMVVEFNESLVSPEQIREDIHRQGYQVVAVSG